MSCPRLPTLRAIGFGLAGLLAVAAAFGQDPFRLKPGARGEVCLECHADIQETMQLAHVHTPVKSGACSDCHNPHASTHGMLLADEPRRICFECHDVVGDAPVSAHETVLEGDCAACHDPHASGNENILVRGGNELCNECHTEIAGAVAEARFGHAPVRDDCLTCHDPHASDESGALLVKSEPELCMDCHDVTGSAFRDRHMGYSVDRGRCSSCHDPHGSTEGGILWAHVHQPVASRKCDQCHGQPGTPDALEPKRAGIDMCLGCHNEVVAPVLAAKNPHWPVVDRKACLNCHDPHASAHAGLLTEPLRPLCGSCHGDVLAREERSAVRHMPVEEDECVTCHAPHGSEHPFLFEAENTIELCAACHDWESHSSHPIGKDVVDMRNPNLELDCTSCHRTHGSPHPALSSFDPKAELCVDCHETMRR